MHTLTIDALAGGGRVIIGIGVSGPQIVEGWYGQPWGHPTDIGDEQHIRRRWASWTPPPLSTGPIVDVPGIEELRLVASLRDGS